MEHDDEPCTMDWCYKLACRAVAVVGIVLVCASLVFCAKANAQVVGLHLGSQHSNDPKGLANNLNPGLYVRFDNGFTAGFYKNSLHKDTFYAGWTAPEFYRVSVTIGGASGYRNDGQAFNLIPIIVPSIRIFTYDSDTKSFDGDPNKVGTVSFRMTVIPRIYAEGQDIFHFMVERRF